MVDYLMESFDDDKNDLVNWLEDKHKKYPEDGNLKNIIDSLKEVKNDAKDLAELKGTIKSLVSVVQSQDVKKNLMVQIDVIIQTANLERQRESDSKAAQQGKRERETAKQTERDARDEIIKTEKATRVEKTNSTNKTLNQMLVGKSPAQQAKKQEKVEKKESAARAKLTANSPVDRENKKREGHNRVEAWKDKVNKAAGMTLFSKTKLPTGNILEPKPKGPSSPRRK